MQQVYLGFVRLWFGLSPCLVYVDVLFDVGKAVDTERVLRVEWVPVHSGYGVRSIVCVFELYKHIAEKEVNSVPLVHDVQKIQAYPLLLSFASSHGINMSSGFTGALFFPKSFDTFANSFSNFDLSTIGIPSTTTIWSKPSSNWTWYLDGEK